VLLRGIGILPMISSNHGQDARATSLQNRGNRCKELRRKRSSLAGFCNRFVILDF
jgi:hypothetical protein